jgi:hypothetical protein
MPQVKVIKEVIDVNEPTTVEKLKNHNTFSADGGVTWETVQAVLADNGTVRVSVYHSINDIALDRPKVRFYDLQPLTPVLIRRRSYVYGTREI